MQGSLWCLKALKAPKHIVGEKPLTNKLLFQMDNCVKDNKNRHLLVFLSLLQQKRSLKRSSWDFLLFIRMKTLM
jgi:hypothetical protein